MKNAIALMGLSEEETGYAIRINCSLQQEAILNRLLVQTLRTFLKPNYGVDSVILKVSRCPFAA